MNYTDRETSWTRIIGHKWFELISPAEQQKQREEYGDKMVMYREYSSKWKSGDEPYYPVNYEKNSSLLAQYKDLAD